MAAQWSTLSIHFDPFAPLKPPLQAALQILETVQAILEALLDLIRTFLLGLLSPIFALIALLLAAVRAIINQIASTGFAVLLVHPNFDAQDINAVFGSVSGSYPAFQSKVFSKFYDTSDAFRPTYPPGSSVAMLVLYIGVDTPGDLLTQLFALLNFLKYPKILTGLPAPVEVQVLPVFQSGAVVQQFADLFGSIGSGPNSYASQLVLQWRMPNSPLGVNQPSFISHLTGFFTQFRFPNFIVERSTTSTGENVPVQPRSGASNQSIQPLMTLYNFPSPSGLVDLREQDGGAVYRNFATKIPVSGQDLLEGFATGTYKFIDKDPALVPGVAYYYRVRAYFGIPSDYLNTNVKGISGAPADAAGELGQIQSAVNAIATSTTLLKYSGNRVYLNYGDGVVMGRTSPVVKAIIPQPWPDAANFNPYQNINDAIQTAVLLNFDLPPAQTGDNANEQSQKTGWGSIGQIGGQMAPIKSAFNNSQVLFSNIAFQTTCRHIANTCSSNMPLQLVNTLAKQWNAQTQRNDGGTESLSQMVDRVLGTPGAQSTSAVGKAIRALSPVGASNRPGPEVIWGFPAVSGGITKANTDKINAYLSIEQTGPTGNGYQNGQPLTNSNGVYGPLPTLSVYITNNSGDLSVSVDARQKLSTFIHTCLASTANVGYLSWYSITLGDFLSPLLAFIYDFEQFLLALLKALKALIAEIEAIVNTIIQKIQQLEAVLITLLQLIDLLNITINISVLAYTSGSGSVDDLAQALVQSGNQPGTSPFGLHSGMVMTFGGPGAGFTAAFNALLFILSAGKL
jgi:hypothetical protein